VGFGSFGVFGVFCISGCLGCDMFSLFLWVCIDRIVFFGFSVFGFLGELVGVLSGLVFVGLVF